MDFIEVAAVMKAISHPVRLQIVAGLIKKNECNVNNMVAGLGLPQPSVSQHLTVLKAAGVIEGYRKGTQICYKVINDTAIKLVNSLE